MMDPPVKEYWPDLHVHYCSGNVLWGTKGHWVVRSLDGGKTWDLLTRIPASVILYLLASVEPVRRLLRLGIRSYLQIDSKSFLVFSHGTSFYWHEALRNPICIGKTRHGVGPLPRGCCRDDRGICYYGEYWGNKRRDEVFVYVWRAHERCWRPSYRFPKGNLRHIHAVQFDPFSAKVWVATGDRDPECMIGYFDGPVHSPQLVIVVSGSQVARAVSLTFTSDYVYWGSDAGRDTDIPCNWIYRWSRKNGQIERLAPVSGPVYYSTVDDQGRLFISTAVEGSPSEVDRFARVYMSKDGTTWREIARWEKDSYPMCLGYGVLAFPQGVPSNGRLYVVGQGVKGAPGTWVLEV